MELKNVKKINIPQGNVMYIQIGGTTVWNRKLPSQYQEVEYIQANSSAQYINTNVIPANNIGYKITFKMTSVYNAQIFGVQQSAGNAIRMGIYSSKMYTSFGADYPDSNLRPTFYTNLYTTAEINFNNNRKIKLGDTAFTFTLPQLSTTYTYPIYLFGLNNMGTLNRSECQIKEFTVTQGTEVIKHLIACYRKSDNKTGMYDIVNDVFYTDPRGLNFIKGEDV